MKHAGVVGCVLLLLNAAGCGGFWGGAAARGNERFIDLTHAFDVSTIYWPTEDGFVLEKEFAGTTQGGWHYEANRFRGAEHGGTHLDAPRHFAQVGQSAETVPLDRLIGDAVVIDVMRPCTEDRDHAISVDDVIAFESLNGVIPEGAIVLLRTGWSNNWPDRERYLGTALRGRAGVARLSFPGLSAEAARFLVEERNVGAVGIDTASIDPGVSTTFEAHQVLGAANVPVFENLANLDRLPPRDFEVVALPMKIGGGSGAPLRAVAILRD